MLSSHFDGSDVHRTAYDPVSKTFFMASSGETNFDILAQGEEGSQGITLPPYEPAGQVLEESDSSADAALQSSNKSDGPFTDSWSVLRFVKGTQGVSISPSGLTVTVSKGSSNPKNKKKEKEEKAKLPAESVDLT